MYNTSSALKHLLTTFKKENPKLMYSHEGVTMYPSANDPKTNISVISRAYNMFTTKMTLLTIILVVAWGK